MSATVSTFQEVGEKIKLTLNFDAFLGVISNSLFADKQLLPKGLDIYAGSGKYKWQFVWEEIDDLERHISDKLPERQK